MKLDRFLKKFYAGVVIGLGAVANLALGGGIVGACVFSFALLLICALGFDLFTGKVGATFLGEYELSSLAQAYFYNALGILFVVLLTWFSPKEEIMRETALAIAMAREETPILISVFMGIFCGMCVQLAVDGWRETKQPLVVMLPVIVFMGAGAHHCIADMFYVAYASGVGFYSILWTTIGNIIGSFIFVERRWHQARVVGKRQDSA